MKIEKFRTEYGLGLVTREHISEGMLLFSHEAWKEDEKEGWEILTIDEIERLDPMQRSIFLRYSYDLDFGISIGTFEWKHARHISNFMNHSCSPNMVYDYNDNIIARQDIPAGEELTIDYGTFVVNFDQDFECSCGSPNCRGRILKDDWKFLHPLYGLHFPRFIAQAINLDAILPAKELEPLSQV